MKNTIPKLKLFDVYRPMLIHAYETDQYDEDAQSEFAKTIDVVRYGVIFDCRALPTDFVLDSGTDYDMPNWLPSAECYFELEDSSGIAAWLSADDPGISFTPLLEREVNGEPMVGCPAAGGMVGVLDTDYIPSPDDRTTDDLGDPESEVYKLIRHAAIMLKGIICLLTEKLVLDRIEPEKTPHLNRARIKKGKLPLDAETHVLTLYVPAIRYAASKHPTPSGTHATPALHWRRGHHRVLGRGTEHEKETTVRRHLVGDPGKGFIRPIYRLKARKGHG